MKLLLFALIPLAFTLVLFLRAAPAGRDEPSAGSLLSHDVFFALKDNSPGEKKKLVEACKKYLANHPGTVFFSAGVLAEDLSREVNDRDFDVALHVVFKNKAAHDRYQEADSHKTFIAENRENWKKVRVFDSYVEPAAK
jgi:hypothetical protein